MTRLFIGLPLNSSLAGNLSEVQDFLTRNSFLIKPVQPENYHLTLKFLGECEGGLARDVEKGFEALSLKPGDLSYALTGLGSFPDLKRATVLWCGLETDMKRLQSLHGDIEKFTASLGFPREKKPLVPHLTLGRVRKGRKLTGEIISFFEKNRNSRFGESSFDKMILYASRLTPGGPVYQPLKTLHLS